MSKYTKQTISNVPEWLTIDLWNLRCDMLGYVDDRIYENNDAFKTELIDNLTQNKLIVMQESGLYSEEEPYVWMNHRANTWQSSFKPLENRYSPYNEKLLLEWMNGNHRPATSLQSSNGLYTGRYDWFWLIIQIAAVLVMAALALAAVTGKL